MLIRPGRLLSHSRKTIVAGYSFTNPEAETLVAAMSATPDDTRKALIDTYVGAVKTAGVFAKLDIWDVHAAHDEQAGKLNWKNPGTNTCTAVNSPTFTTDRGFTGNGTTSYLNSNYNPGAGGFNYVQNSAHVGSWILNDIAANTTVAIGGRGASNGCIIQPFNSSNLTGRANAAASFNSSARPNSSGHKLIRRSAANAQASYDDAVSVGTNADASTTVSNVNLYIGAFNANGSAANFSTYQIAVTHAGSSLTDTEITDFYTATLTYLQALGAV